MDRNQLKRHRVKLCLVAGLLMLGAGAVPIGMMKRPAGSEVQWLTNFPVAQHKARMLGEPLLIDFFAPWCGPCGMMDRDVYSNRAVADELQNFVCVRLDVELHPDEAQRFRVSGIPRMLILDTDGAVVADQVGYTGLDDGLQIIRSGYDAAGKPSKP